MLGEMARRERSRDGLYSNREIRMSKIDFGRIRTSRRVLSEVKQRGPRRFWTPSDLDLAEWTGLEPATPGVTGRYSNQLNYHSRIRLKLLLVGAERLELPTFAL